MADKMPIEKKKCKTPEGRVSFPQVFKPKSFRNQEPKFSMTLLFKKSSADLTEMKRAAANAAIEKWGPKENWPKKLKWPFRDGDKDQPDMKGYPGHIFVSMTSKTKPGLIDRQKNPIDEASGSFYAGCYAHATCIAFAYDVEGSKGVSFALQNIQKLRDGEPFSGKRSAEDEFDALEDVDSSDDPTNYEDSEDEDLDNL